MRQSHLANEVTEGIDLTGRRAVVTGASFGLGAETARALAITGAAVTLAVRDVAAGERVAKDITTASTGNQEVRAAHLDLRAPRHLAPPRRRRRPPLRRLQRDRGRRPPLGTPHGVARYAIDPDNTRRLWTLSQDLLTHTG
ncbi:SDR family NAD(P)-dependent oxidoreductase [Streptomyces sp. PSAA01]|uniref:SDR family NAD(P)-dependent oxidoreductase n=1 Tax=Streptomyces sp. PSAA01 TaxID=2912762 RepID=UPI0035ABF2D3